MAGIRMENKIYEVGMYCRLSKDDGTDNESASIATQKSILTDYVKKQGWHLAKTYVDDGYSGTNFQRPSFQNMIKDIESGLINCVITKDLSRLGRNYLDCGLYLEVFFPEHNVRYIAVNDGVDTLNKSAMDITPFRNILNEMYSADVSVKIKSAYRARFQQGKFMGTTAPYGYVKDPADHNHLLIDDILDRTHGHNDRNIHSCPKFNSCLFRPFHDPPLLSPGGNNNQKKHCESYTADICINAQCHTENVANQIACHVAACQIVTDFLYEFYYITCLIRE